MGLALVCDVRRSESSNGFYARVRKLDLRPDAAALGIRYETIRGRGAYSTEWMHGTCYLDGCEVFNVGSYAMFRPTALLQLAEGAHEIEVFGARRRSNVTPPLVVSRTISIAVGTRAVAHVVPGRRYGFRNEKNHPGHVDIEHLG